MAFSVVFTTIIVVIVTLGYAVYRLRIRSSQLDREAEAKLAVPKLDVEIPETARRLRKKLYAELPQSIILPDDTELFKSSIGSYWAQQSCETIPSCIVCPRSAEELSRAVRVLKFEYESQSKSSERSSKDTRGLFAIRSGGHSPLAGASSIQGGVLIDLSLFNEVTPAVDNKSVLIGAGCKWFDVYKVLEKRGLAVAGGRNSAVGVGGFTLGGGISFFSPRFGLMCSNIIEYEIVLADGSIATASEAENPDLWRALKGGSNNFGIVMRFTARTFPSADIWSGFLYMSPWQAPKVLSAFHEFLDRGINPGEDKAYDEHAAGPLACFTYLQQLGIQAVAVALTHTAAPADDKKWPTCWQTSAFSKFWRFWSTCSVKSLAAATDEMNALNAPGRRQKFATTTVKNDLATLEEVHKAYRDAIGPIRHNNIKSMSWTLVLQPLHPHWACKGDPNALGLGVATDQPLVNVSFTVNWEKSQDDETVEQITRAAIEQIDAYAQKHDTAHHYRYINYCDSWQNPFAGYGEDNHALLRDVSRKYDPEGLFQRGCVGGFKLGV